MGGFAEDLHGYFGLGRCSNRNSSNLAVGIQCKAHVSIQMFGVQSPGAKQPGFFTGCNDKLDLTVSNALFLNDTDRFEQSS
ncbi:hypothetical protein D3C71_1990360 [compost metagenome]